MPLDLPVYFQQLINMKKRKEGAAAGGALSKSKRQRSSNSNSPPNSPLSSAVPPKSKVSSPFDIVLEALKKINQGNNSGYYYQVCLQPGKEIYSGIGTFSNLFNLSEDDTMEVLTASGLVGIDHKIKPYIFQH